MRKAQAAMEFLMTYGWAILVVLIAIGALAYFGVLNPDKFIGEKCTIATGSGLFCDDYSVSGTTVTLRIKNILSDAVTIATLNVSATNEACTQSAPATNIAADSTADLTVTCGTLVSGDKLSGDIIVGYSKSGGLSKTATGQLVIKVP